MKYSLSLIALLTLALTYFVLRPLKVNYITDDSKYLSAIKQVREDSLYRVKREANVVTLQGKIDSLTRYAARLQTMTTPALDSVAKIVSVKRDSLICTDEKTYRRLVISSLNFGEEKYSLCLGQLSEKDSIIQSFNASLAQMTLSATELNTSRKEIVLELESVKQSRYHWFWTGMGLGIGASLLSMYLAR